jgi:hypothetical protein
MISLRAPFLPRLAAGLLLGAFVAGPAFATDPAPLPAWEQLTAAQREQLIAPVRERWNADPAQRQAMLERARRWQQLSPEQRRHARRGMKRWEHMSPDQRAHARALYSRMRTLDPSARQALKARWRAMTPAQRDAWVEANPAPAAREPKP